MKSLCRRVWSSGTVGTVYQPAASRGTVLAMASKLAPFADLAAFESLDAAKRLALAAPLAESLGKDFRPLPELVGSKGMVGVEHVPSGVELVAVPGGSFEMGFTDRDDEE